MEYNEDDVNTLSVLSLNCWGLYLVAKQREFRLKAIGNTLLEQNVDIVALQEVWMLKDFEYIKTTLSNKLPFSCYFQSGTLGSGLAIFSKFPILSSSYLKFTLAGRPFKILEGDYYVGKGCGSVCIEHPKLGYIDVYTTHLQACYGNKDEYEAQRITECWQIANQVRNSISQGRHVILAGDFNSIPTSYSYNVLVNHGFMTDSWYEMNHSELENNQFLFEKNELSLSKCIQCFGITCDSPLNTWTKHYLKQQPHQKDIGDRLDYIFYYSSSHMQCEQSRVTLQDCIPKTNMSFSDHFAVHSIFRINTTVEHTSVKAVPPTPNQTNVSLTTLQDIITLLNQDRERSIKSTMRLLSVFITSVLVAICLLISIWFVRDWVASALMGLFIFLFSVIGTLCLIVGFVFGKMEQRSLAQYITDITNCMMNNDNNK